MSSMTELAFARQFLTALDSRPVKLPSDSIADPRTFSGQGTYTIPRLPSQPSKRKREPAAAAPGASRAEPSVTVLLRNSKTPSASETLDAQPLTTSVFDLKAAYASHSGAALDKIKLLYNKKPTSDAKTLKEILGDAAGQAGDVEFTVMVMGGVPAAAATSNPQVEAPSPVEVKSDAPAVAQGVSGKEVLREEGFWRDLEAFLLQRVRDEKEAVRLAGLFRGAWEGSP